MFKVTVTANTTGFPQLTNPFNVREIEGHIYYAGLAGYEGAIQIKFQVNGDTFDLALPVNKNVRLECDEIRNALVNRYVRTSDFNIQKQVLLLLGAIYMGLV